jgi:hypothetical protein
MLRQGHMMHKDDHSRVSQQTCSFTPLGLAGVGIMMVSHI